MYCQNCGAQLPDGAKFCGNCGCRVSMDYDPGVAPRYQEETTVINMIPDEKPKKGCFSRILRFVLIVALIITALFVWAIFQMDIYVYKTHTIISDYELTSQEKREIDELFEGAYIFASDGTYEVFYPETGLGGEISEKLLREQMSDLEDGEIEIASNGNYFYIKFSLHDESITFSFFKASASERFRFVSTYFSF